MEHVVPLFRFGDQAPYVTLSVHRDEIANTSDARINIYGA